MEDLAKKSKKSIYCQVQFLESLQKDNKFVTNLKDNVDFFDIVRDSIIYFDKSEDEIKSHSRSNPYISRLIKMDVNGECNIDWLDDELKIEDYINSYKETDGTLDYSPILFIYQVKKQQKSCNNLCYKYRTQYGLMVYDQDCYQEIGIAFKDSGYAVKRNSIEGWKKSLEQKNITGNALVIIDDYLLNNIDLYDNNLYEILDVLLPWTIQIPFYLTFFTKKSSLDIVLQLKRIEKKIKELRPKYFNEGSDLYGLIKINIIEDGRNIFHDRVILTNYCWISCGSGFDLYTKSQKAKHSTNVSILYPFIQYHVKWAKDAYLDFLDDSKTVFLDAQRGYNKWSDCSLYNNRLFMMESSI